MTTKTAKQNKGQGSLEFTWAICNNKEKYVNWFIWRFDLILQFV